MLCSWAELSFLLSREITDFVEKKGLEVSSAVEAALGAPSCFPFEPLETSYREEGL